MHQLCEAMGRVIKYFVCFILVVGLSIVASSGLAGAVLHPEYTIEGISLGARVDFQLPNNRDFRCRPSAQFGGFTFCQRRREMSEARGVYMSENTVLYAADGAAVYVNRFLEPAFFNGNEAQTDIDFRTKRFGYAPSRFIPMPTNSGVPNGMIVAWGQIGLEPVAPNVVRDIAEGKPVQVGFMIDHIGNLRRSATLGLPIYRYAGGAGYVWAASWDANGIGTLQFLTTDPSTYLTGAIPNVVDPLSSGGCSEHWIC
jgi:hypothetical protein